uniref:Uncharacterized protein n=1 Tax=Ananas comosus var. bracteatus TaxID=296719 RepID=A0A6V7QCQ5_ANACO|nr:unnamed protein product [Ananas comosus var. bracteatus]
MGDRSGRGDQPRAEGEGDVDRTENAHQMLDRFHSTKQIQSSTRVARIKAIDLSIDRSLSPPISRSNLPPHPHKLRRGSIAVGDDDDAEARGGGEELRRGSEEEGVARASSTDPGRAPNARSISSEKKEEEEEEEENDEVRGFRWKRGEREMGLYRDEAQIREAPIAKY